MISRLMSVSTARSLALSLAARALAASRLAFAIAAPAASVK